MDNIADDDDYTVDIRSFLEFYHKLRDLDGDFENDVNLDEHAGIQYRDQLLAIAAKGSRYSFAHSVWLGLMQEHVAVIENLHRLPASEIVIPGSGHDNPQWWYSGDRLMDPAVLQYMIEKSGIAAHVEMFEALQQETLLDVYGTPSRNAPKSECWMKGRPFTDDHRMFQKVAGAGFNVLDVMHAPIRELRFGRVVRAEFEPPEVLVGSDNVFSKYGAAASSGSRSRTTMSRSQISLWCTMAASSATTILGW